MRIYVNVIPHRSQRYDTVGDWIFGDNGNLTINVSDMKDWRYEFLVAFHELIEAMLCKQRGISQEEVDDFDIAFEARRVRGDLSEPGDNALAPYYNEHQFATCLERLMALELGVIWKEYDEKVSSL